MKKSGRYGVCLEILFVVVLVIYPLRHINWGLDLWDTGYNYSNFQYMGLEHMDSMWLFATYLANAAGNLLMRLPCAGSLLGMNFYTGLIVSLLAVSGYLFCTRRLGMPGWIALIGELVAVSLCWCPTAVLYNYLTYAFLLACTVLLYVGLTEDKNICLVLAGVCLGANVLVRVSNLPEMVLILAVWEYDISVWSRKRREGGALDKSLWRGLGRHTLWCFAGYALSLSVLFTYIHMKYGISEYVSGIRRLFAMTSDHTAYRPDGMLINMIKTYGENMYWVVLFGLVLAAGMALFAAADRLLQHGGRRLCWWCGRILLASAGSVTLAWLCVKVFRTSEKVMTAFAGKEFLLHPAVLPVVLFPVGILLYSVAGYPLQKRFGMEKAFQWELRCLWGLVSFAVLAWLYMKGFCTTDFLGNGPVDYSVMLRPGILFLMLCLLSGFTGLLTRKGSEKEKLVSIMVVLVVLVTAIGSNNLLFLSLNNLFLAAPVTLWRCWRFCRKAKSKRVGAILFSAYPVKGLLAAFTGLCLFQFYGFGAKFAYAEADGVYDLTASVDNNGILAGIRMNPEKARWMTELSDYVNEHGLQGREVILFGNVPALSYYLQMPPAFNSWCDLASYSSDTLEEALWEEELQIRENGSEGPVVLVDWQDGGLEANDHGEMVLQFMGRNGYELAWQNDRFAIYGTGIVR